MAGKGGHVGKKRKRPETKKQETKPKPGAATFTCMAAPSRRQASRWLRCQVLCMHVAESGDVDDFEFMWDEAPPPPPVASGSDSEASADDGETASQHQVEGMEDEDEWETEQQQEGDEQGGRAECAEEGPQPQQQDAGKVKRKEKAAKRKQRRGAKLSVLEWEASRQLAASISDQPPEEQADYLWSCYQKTTQASALERGPLTAEAFAQLPTAAGGLESRLKALEGSSWKEAFCSAPADAPGSPAVLFVSMAALGAAAFIKHCPAFNKVQGPEAVLFPCMPWQTAAVCDLAEAMPARQPCCHRMTLHRPDSRLLLRRPLAVITWQ